jgi:integrase/recombinase XerD
MPKPTIYIKDDYVNKNGECSLYLRIYMQNSYCYINLDIDVKPENFDKKAFHLISGERRKEKNLQIKEAIGRAADIILRYQVQKKTLTKDLFVKEYSNPSIITDFYSFADDAIKSRHDIVYSTKNLQFAVINKMRQVKPNLLLVELDEDYLTEYAKFWTRKGNKKNTLGKDFKTMKTYVNIALKKELITRDPFMFFKHRDEKTYPEFLTEEEINKLIDLYNEKSLKDYYQITLRYFIFVCYTGLRISDLKRITFENIFQKNLKFKPYKLLNTTGEKITVPLCKMALRMIKDERPNGLSGVIFTKFSENRLNMYIKEVMRYAGVKKHVTFHVGRHTFATQFLRKATRANGILMLQKLLGHAKIDSTMIYSHVLTDDIEDAMKQFD